jgi:hypothetical protein
VRATGTFRCAPRCRARTPCRHLIDVNHSIRFSEPEDVLVVTSGAASLTGFDAIVTELLSDIRYRPGMTILVDHTRLDWNGLLVGDLVRRLHVALKKADLIGPRRIAVVAPGSDLAEAHARPTDAPTWQHFGTIEEARRWLEGVPTSR